MMTKIFPLPSKRKGKTHRTKLGPPLSPSQVPTLVLILLSAQNCEAARKSGRLFLILRRSLLSVFLYFLLHSSLDLFHSAIKIFHWIK